MKRSTYGTEYSEEYMDQYIEQELEEYIEVKIRDELRGCSEESAFAPTRPARRLTCTATAPTTAGLAEHRRAA